ncbi:prepilin-type N-terminal cleavage/methylation domain-containing protein [Candidatus Pelagibacter sp.]|nr:prepilin-type N-terminal cleavage/methylation domain-containing protein [Candidatus Pelagibacter sp.]
MSGFYNKNNSGLTLLEALVATVIVGIGFVAVFQMVQYSVRSIDISSDRNKGNYLVNLIAEDVLSHKRSTKDNKEFADYLKENQFSIQQCTNEFGLETKDNTPENKVQYWQQYFDRGITKCRSIEDIRALNIIDICDDETSDDKTWTCSYKNEKEYTYNENGAEVKTKIYDPVYFGKMEIRFNKGKKTRNLYFQIK